MRRVVVLAFLLCAAAPAGAQPRWFLQVRSLVESVLPEPPARRVPALSPEAGQAALSDRLTARVDRRADAVALSVPPAATRSVRALADHLSAHAGPSMRGRTRAAFRFVAHHVAYDVESLRPFRRKSQHPRDVLRSGLGVCEGYARLLVTLLDAMGLETAFVTGHADPSGPGGGGLHAWVAVRLADGWYLLDPTWAAGGIGPDGRFRRRFDDAWWLVPPSRMAQTHSPGARAWSLLR